MTDLTSLTLAEARDRLKSRAISSVEITKAHLEAIERAEGLNAFVAITADKALQMAEASDARLAGDEPARSKGCRSGSRISMRPRGSTPKPAAIFWRASTALQVDRHR